MLSPTEICLALRLHHWTDWLSLPCGWHWPLPIYLRFKWASHCNLVYFLLSFHLVSLLDLFPTSFCQLLPPFFSINFSFITLIDLRLKCALFLEPLVSLLDKTSRTLMSRVFMTFSKITADCWLQELCVILYGYWRLFTLNIILLHWSIFFHSLLFLIESLWRLWLTFISIRTFLILSVNLWWIFKAV